MSKIFQEENTITIPKFEDVLIYFLLDQNDVVVYVGQTTNGISRPLSHKNDKDFSKIQIMYCDEKELDIYENYFITKYKPKYNKTLPSSESYSFMRVRNEVRTMTGWKDFSRWDVRKYIKKLKIPVVHFNDKEYIHVNYLIAMIDAIEEELCERQTNA